MEKFLSITRRKEENNELDVSVKTWERVVIDGYTFKVKAYFINHRLDKIRLLKRERICPVLRI